MSKKSFISIILGISVLMGGIAPSQALGQNTEDDSTLIQDLSAQVQALIAQVAVLQEQINQLRGEQSELQGEIKTLRLEARQLREGISGEDVTLLQEILSTDPEIYPEGLVTGFFGPLTKGAVKKFQKKFGIEQVGEVGPLTRAKLNQLLSEGAGKSGKVPPGLLIAPGIAKKIGGSPAIPEGQKLPPGIAKKLGVPQVPDDNGDNGDQDPTAPSILTLVPADDAAQVAVETDLVITFSEDVQAGSGDLTVKKSSDDSIVETVNVGMATGAGTDTVTFDLISSLASDTGYYVLMDSGIFTGSASSVFDGITATTTWNFTTATTVSQ